MIGLRVTKMEPAIDSSFYLAKVKKAPCIGAVKRKNFKQYYYITRGYTRQSQNRANK